MEIQVDPTLLVVNLENCINADATRQIVKGGSCMYTVAVTTNDDTTMVQIPVSVHCAGDVQTAFGVLPELQDHSKSQSQHQCSQVQNDPYTQIPGNVQGLGDSNYQIESKVPEIQSDVLPEQPVSLDINTLYYNDIFNFLTNNTMPEGATASHKLLLKKRAKSYCVKDGILYYGHSKPKKVITDKEEQLKILQDVHVEKGTGIHLGVKKMYRAVNTVCFWRGQYMDVANYVRQCSKCTEVGETRLVNIQDLYPEERRDENEISKELFSDKTTGIWEKVEVAIHGPYSKTESNNEFLVTLIDPVSQWVVAQSIPGDSLASHLTSFIQLTFCLFGFAKCHVGKLPEDLKEAIQNVYKQQENSLQYLLSKLGLPSDALLKDSIFVFNEEDGECVWINSIIKSYVCNHPTTWDSELTKFIFELNTSKRGAHQTPFSRMFCRNPAGVFGDNKENADRHLLNIENDITSKRRVLQSSILQCRHCEEIFTSKISFRIHQRKHTEEARRRGILKSEEPLKIVSNRERRLLKRPVVFKRKQQLLRQHGFKKMRVVHVSNKIQRKYAKFIGKQDWSHRITQKDDMLVASNLSTSLESTSSQNLQETLLMTCVDSSQDSNDLFTSSESHRGALTNINSISSQDSRNITCNRLTTALPLVKGIPEKNLNIDSDSNFLSSSEPVTLLGNDYLSRDLLKDSSNSSQFGSNNQALSVEKSATEIILNEQNGSSNNSKNLIAQPSNNKEIDSSPMIENNHNVTPSDKFSVITNEALINQVLTNINSKVIINDSLNSYNTVFVSHDPQDATNHVQLCTSSSGINLTDPMEGIELIYSTDSLEELTAISSELKPEAGQDCVSEGVNARISSQDLFICDHCDRKFVCKSRLASHIKRMHSSGMLLSCSKCSYTAKCKELLKHHQAIHEGTFKCTECNKLFSRKIYLKYHMASQHGEFRFYYMCTECGAQFRSVTGLKRHMRTKHEPLKEYRCSLCDYVGNCLNSLSCHFERLHNKQFKCSDCNYQSTTESGLKKHVEIVHNVEERRFPCKLCSYRGAKRRQLLEHERNVHNPSINMHKCPICQKTFKTAVMLKHHLLCHTDRLLYSCRSCEYISRHRQTLHYHIKRMHPGKDVKSLSIGPSEADFQAIINSATQQLTPVEQAGEDEEDYANVPSQIINSNELMLSNDYLPESFELKPPEAFELKPLASVIVDSKSVTCESITENSNLESSQIVTFMDDHSLDNDKHYKLIPLSNVVSLGENEMDHLVTFSKDDSESVNNITFIADKPDQIVSYIEELESSHSYSNQQSGDLLASPGIESSEKVSSQPSLNTFVVCNNGEQIEKNDEILPLVNTSIIFQDDINDSQDPVLDHESPLLDFVSQQPVYEEEVSSWDHVTVYQLNS